jgi:RNA polymerase sigma-70 factor (ECF subfamily)
MSISPCPTSLPVLPCVPSLACKPPRAQVVARDAEVVALAKAGDHDAFSELYFRYKGYVFSICIRAVHDYSLAEDLTQETFLQLHRKIASFRGESAFTTWLHRMTVNTVLMYVRKRALLMVSLDELATEEPGERAGHEFGAMDMRQSGLIDRLSLERAAACLAPGYRAVFEFYDVQGFSHQEIATKLNCTTGNTKSQLHKAREALRYILEPASGRNVPIRSFH